MNTLNTQQIPCPYCGQDWLKPARVRQTGAVILICEECDSVRISDDEEDDTNYSDYAQANGFPALYDELEMLSAE